MVKRKTNAKPVEVPQLPEGFSWGRDIDPKAMDYGQVAVTPDGRPTAYLGFMDLNHLDVAFQYSVSVGGRTPEDRKGYQFLELRAGGLHLTSFLRDNQPFRVREDLSVSLPRSTDNTFGVVTDKRELDVEMTRTFFGATFDELDEFIGQFYAAIRYAPEPEWHLKLARITFSKSRDNSCDLSGVHIPKEFPFIAFTDTQYFGGHVSLEGFYRQLAFLCHYRQRHDGTIEGEAFFKRLVECGAKPALIVQLCQAAFAGMGHGLSDPTETLLRLEADEKRRRPYRP